MITIPNYKIFYQLYESSNSWLYRALRIEDNQRVILKIPKENSPKQLAHYRQEYEITNRLNLAGVIKAYHLEKYEDRLVIIFEDFGGDSLKQWMQASEISDWLECLPIFIQATTILGEIHAANIIHKDINPSNLVWNQNTGQLKIIDFGISTILPRENPSLKNPNKLEGTLAYLSPEQTGRMNRAMDYRTDFYALGVTFYELLTHHLPFETDDTMELLHCHLAKKAIPPHILNSDIPEMISHIIMKLLEKAAEARYQSAWGLKADLEKCLKQPHFILGQEDISDKFQLPQKLYGRESEIETLLDTFHNTSQGKSALMLVAGYSGIGKSVLVQEIYKPITETQGYFIAGKFDQFQRNIPYSAFQMAFRDLVQQLLTENETQLASWKSKIIAAVGPNGQVITEIIPEIEIIIGTQSPVPKLGSTAAQNRFNLVFQNFIQVFCQAKHPLVIFLDDLQWADSASLKLIELIMPQSQYLFLIGAYRDNEVDAIHPLMLTKEELQKNSINIKTLTLAPLGLPDINQFVADTVCDTLEKTRALAQLVMTKTGGNPFFMGEFLKTLYTENLFNFDLKQGKWQWDLAQIDVLNITNNVIELMVGKVRKLNEKTQEVLKFAACIGNRFEIEMLAKVYEKDILETKEDFWDALSEGLVFSVENDYKFAHDRIQQAVYSIIPDEQKQAVHWKIGQFMLARDRQKQSIFSIVDQLNSGIELINQQSERDALARLNLTAGQKAKASAAYQAAFNYLTFGLSLLGDNWQTQYDLVLNLHVEAAEAAALNGNSEEMDTLIEEVLQQAKTLLEKVRVYEIRISSYIIQNKLMEAVALGLQVLTLLEISLPQKPTKSQIILGLLETKITVGRKEIEYFENLPEMTNPSKLAAMRIISSISPAAYLATPEMLPLLAFKLVTLSVKYGNMTLSAYAYAGYGMILCGVVGDIERGYQFGQLALRLEERFQAKEFKSKVTYVVNNFIVHWKEHTRNVLKPLMGAYQIGLETGDIEFAGFSLMGCPFQLCFIGENLNSIEKEMLKYRHSIVQGASSFLYEISWQVILNLQGKSEDPCSLSGEDYDEETMLFLYNDSKNNNAICRYYSSKLMLCYLFQAYHDAKVNALLAEKYLTGVTSSTQVPVFYFYDSLTKLAVNDNSKKVAANQKKMKKWAHHAPMNYQHKFYLVEAERARVSGKDEKAREYYDQAIALAHKNEYVNEEALGNELAGHFYLAKGQNHLANHYLREAIGAYARWGALAKVKDLQTRYPQLKEKVHSTTVTTTNTCVVDSASGMLDFTSILKASQAIAGEMDLARLLENLMKIVIENAGAQQGYLILEKKGDWFIEAEGTDEEVKVLQAQKIEPNQFPCTLINYISHAKESVVLHDAAQKGQFTSDQYFVENKTKSVLGIPLLNQGQLMGILYLENNLTTEVFTPKRLQVLSVLSSQAAISLENAQLYHTLEQKVEERTGQLAQANQEILQLNEQLKSDNFRMSAELDVSRQLQQMILPKEEELQRIEGLDIAGFMEAADEVGGDYYDVLHHNDRVLIAIGDVTGHGLESGVLAIMVQTAVRSLLVNNEMDPVKFLTSINTTLYENVQRMDCDKNMTLILLDYKDGQLSLSGQHEEMIVVRKGNVEVIDTIDLGFPVGMLDDISEYVNQITVTLNTGDVAVLYTDGITEAENIQREEYGLERLCDIVQVNWQSSVDDIRQAVIDNVRQYIGQQKVFDDITLLVLKQK